MKKTLFPIILLLLCLLPAACGQGGGKPAQTDTTPTESQDPQDDGQAPSSLPEDGGPVLLDSLTVELVVDWEDADRMLSALDSMKRLLAEALLAQGYDVEEITVTISTAGGFTGEAMSGGGVDVAFLPAADYIAYEKNARAVLVTDEDICEIVAALTLRREELDDGFQSALEQALLETEAGGSFLETYRAGAIFLPASGEAIDAVRDWVTEQGDQHGA